MINKPLTTLITLSFTVVVLYLGNAAARRKPSHQLLVRLQKNIQAKIPQLLTLDTGQGSCHMLLCPEVNLKVVLFDCGSLPKLARHRTHQERFHYLMAQLQPQKIDIIISHADEDHYNLLKDIPFSNELTTKIFVEPHQQNDFIRSIKGDFVEYISSQKNTCGDASFKILRQPIRHHSNNKNSLMLFIQSKNGGSGLLTADITGSEEKYWLPYLQVYAPLDFISASHHGSTSHQSNHLNWAKKLKAKKLIVSSARVAHWLHPRCDAINHFMPYLSKSKTNHMFHCGNFQKGYQAIQTSKSIYTTHDQGDILLELNQGNIVRYFP